MMRGIARLRSPPGRTRRFRCCGYPTNARLRVDLISSRIGPTIGSVIGRFAVILRIRVALSLEPCGAEKRGDSLPLDVTRDPAYVVTRGIQMNRPAIDQSADDIDQPVLGDQLRAA